MPLISPSETWRGHWKPTTPIRGARYLEDNGEGYVVRAAGRLESMEEIEAVVVSTRGGVPVRIRDIAEVRIGRDLRTGSASEDGREVVIGTALMLIGENSRTVSAAVDAKMGQIRKSLPSGVEVQTVLNRTVLGSRPRSRPLQKTSLKVPPSSSSSCFCCSATFARPSSQRS